MLGKKIIIIIIKILFIPISLEVYTPFDFQPILYSVLVFFFVKRVFDMLNVA